MAGAEDNNSESIHNFNNIIPPQEHLQKGVTKLSNAASGGRILLP